MVDRFGAIFNLDCALICPIAVTADGLQGAGKDQPFDAQIFGRLTDIVEADDVGLQQHIYKVGWVGVGAQVNDGIHPFNGLIDFITVIQITHHKIGQPWGRPARKTTDIVTPLEQMFA